MTRDYVIAWLVVAATSGNLRAQQSDTIVVHDYRNGVAGIRAGNPELKLRVDRDSAERAQVLVIDYPAPTNDPAGRDVYLDAENRNWTAGRAILVRVKPSHPIRLSVSFLDRNLVAYTAYAQLRGSEWQSVSILFNEIRPNAYFQPPGAKQGGPLDVSAVSGIGVAPQDRESGQLAIGRIVVVK